MSAHRTRRSDRQHAEELLRGARNGLRTPGSGALSELLSAAAAPATEGELAGEQHALAAFRAAHPVPVPQLRRRSMIKTTLAKLLTVKVAVVAAGTVAAGGVALAATTGALPAHSGSGGAPGSTSTSHPAATSAPTGSEHADAGDGANGGAAKSSADNAGNATPSPSLTGLCQAYTAGAGSDHGKALESPAFQVLITTAGGTDKVSGYCTGLLAAKTAAHQPESTHAAQPTEANRPTEAHSTGAPSTHPSGPPETRPSH